MIFHRFKIKITVKIVDMYINYIIDLQIIAPFLAIWHCEIVKTRKSSWVAIKTNLDNPI